MLTVPKHDQPFTPMGISPLSELASATSVCLSARLDATAAVAAAVAASWLGRQASGSLSVTFCFNLTERQRNSSRGADWEEKFSPVFGDSPRF